MGAYSELDIERQYGDNPFADDEGDDIEGAGPAFEGDGRSDASSAFDEDDAPAVTPVSGTGNVPTVKTNSTTTSQPMEPPAAPPQATDDKSAKDEADEDARRKAHEEAEAKRKAEWKAERKKKKEAEKLLIAQIDSMSDDDVVAAALKRVSDDTEKLTRRNMMDCVKEHIQTLCIEDPAFARKVEHPRKNMIRCYQYINRKAWEYVQDELKARGITPSRTEPYASAIPEGVTYQWSVDYFNDPDAPEDKEKEEKFVPKPYRSTASTASKSSTAKSSTTVKAGGTKDAAPKDTNSAEPKKTDDDGQISFGGFAIPEAKAG